jgi:transcriptional regulator with XRE-family HTH domain
MEITLRGLVLSEYKSITQFARAAGWNRNRAARILNGTQEPTKKDIKTLVQLFGITEEMFIPIFFPGVYTT